MAAARSPNLSSTHAVALEPQWVAPVRIVWIVVAIAAVGLTIAGATYRVDELSLACDGSDCLRDQYTQAQWDAVEERFGVRTVVWYLEALAMLVAAICIVVGWLLFWRQSLHWIGIIASLFLVLVGTEISSNRDALGRAVDLMVWPTDTLQWMTDVLAASLFLLFPSGRFFPRFTGPLLVATASAMFVLRLGPQSLRLPEALDGVPTVFIVLVGIGVQIYRYRLLASKTERQQMKWVFLALTIQAFVFTAAIVVNYSVPLQFESALATPITRAAFFHVYLATFLLIPVALLFSIARYRLWDVDLLIHRSLTYILLTIALAITVGTLVLALQALSQLTLGGEHRPLVLAASTLAAGALFQPLRYQMLRLVDRRFFGIAIDHRVARNLTGAPPQLEQLVDIDLLRPYMDWQLVGWGGMAQVYKAQHVRSQRWVAVKVMRPDSMGKDSRQRFEREARILSELSHPNIVKLVDYDVSDKQYRLMVMDYVSDEDLSQRLAASKRLPLAEVNWIVDDLAAALDYAHSRGVVHRDIKPSNIFLAARDDVTGEDDEPTSDRSRPDYRAVLGDFGIAKAPASTQLTASSVIGTVSHMSPEQIREPATVDRRSDVYSLAILTYQLLTGGTPFDGENSTAVLLAHLQQPPPDPRKVVPGLPEHVVGSLWSALSKLPSARPSTAGDFARNLRGLKPLDAPTVVE